TARTTQGAHQRGSRHRPAQGVLWEPARPRRRSGPPSRGARRSARHGQRGRRSRSRPGASAGRCRSGSRGAGASCTWSWAGAACGTQLRRSSRRWCAPHSRPPGGCVAPRRRRSTWPATSWAAQECRRSWTPRRPQACTWPAWTWRGTAWTARLASGSRAGAGGSPADPRGRSSSRTTPSAAPPWSASCGRSPPVPRRARPRPCRCSGRSEQGRFGGRVAGPRGARDHGLP
ncbi:unnamed protein product, partial [Prorocentrum cordatum]